MLWCYIILSFPLRPVSTLDRFLLNLPPFSTCPPVLGIQGRIHNLYCKVVATVAVAWLADIGTKKGVSEIGSATVDGRPYRANMHGILENTHFCIKRIAIVCTNNAHTAYFIRASCTLRVRYLGHEVTNCHSLPGTNERKSD